MTVTMTAVPTWTWGRRGVGEIGKICAHTRGEAKAKIKRLLGVRGRLPDSYYVEKEKS